VCTSHRVRKEAKSCLEAVVVVLVRNGLEHLSTCDGAGEGVSLGVEPADRVRYSCSCCCSVGERGSERSDEPRWRCGGGWAGDDDVLVRVSTPRVRCGRVETEAGLDRL
jgi:hypothetical protein